MNSTSTKYITSWKTSKKWVKSDIRKREQLVLFFFVLTYQEFNEWVPNNSSVKISKGIKVGGIEIPDKSSGKISKGIKVGGIEIPDKSSGKLPHEFVPDDGRWMGYLFKKMVKKRLMYIW